MKTTNPLSISIAISYSKMISVNKVNKKKEENCGL